MFKYYCPKDCIFLMESSGPWDNPNIGGCSRDDEFPENTEFENDDQYPVCPMYKARRKAKDGAL